MIQYKDKFLKYHKLFSNRMIYIVRKYFVTTIQTEAVCRDIEVTEAQSEGLD